MALKLHWAYMTGDWAVGDHPTPQAAAAARVQDLGCGFGLRLIAWQESGDGEQSRACGQIDVEIRAEEPRPEVDAPRSEPRQYPEGG